MALSPRRELFAFAVALAAIVGVSSPNRSSAVAS